MVLETANVHTVLKMLITILPQTVLYISENARVFTVDVAYHCQQLFPTVKCFKDKHSTSAH